MLTMTMMIMLLLIIINKRRKLRNAFTLHNFKVCSCGYNHFSNVAGHLAKLITSRWWLVQVCIDIYLEMCICVCVCCIYIINNKSEWRTQQVQRTRELERHLHLPTRRVKWSGEVDVMRCWAYFVGSLSLDMKWTDADLIDARSHTISYANFWPRWLGIMNAAGAPLPGIPVMNASAWHCDCHCDCYRSGGEGESARSWLGNGRQMWLLPIRPCSTRARGHAWPLYQFEASP